MKQDPNSGPRIIERHCTKQWPRDFAPEHCALLLPSTTCSKWSPNYSNEVSTQCADLSFNGSFNPSRTTIKLSHIKPRSSLSMAFLFTVRHSSRSSEFTPHYFTHVYPTTKRNISEGLKLSIALIGEGTTNGFSILHNNWSGSTQRNPIMCQHELFPDCDMYPISLEILKDDSFRHSE